MGTKFQGVETPSQVGYCKITKFSGTQFITERFHHGVIPTNDANRIANSKNPDETAPLDAAA